MSKAVQINPEILRWARLSLHLSVDDVASKLKKDPAVVEDWERGEAFPTYVQLEKLAYEIYKRPLALFFFPGPPEEEPIEKSFRALPESELEGIPSRVIFLLRRARVLQLNLTELHDGVNPARCRILGDLNFSPSVAPAEMAEKVRDYLGVGLNVQQSWKKNDKALKHWRDALEERGIFVFKDSFSSHGKKAADTSESRFSGFCLYDDEFPVVYVNNNMPKTRQIFTLFHELAHLLMNTGGVDAQSDDYIGRLSGDNRKIEVLCNRFAAEFLVPARDFQRRSANMPLEDAAISVLADLYCVSRETILRRLFDQGRVDSRFYEQKVQQWLEERDDSSGGRGGDYYLNKGVYLGGRYIEAVISRYHQDRISVEQAADYLDVKTKKVPEMEDWLFNRGMSNERIRL